MKRFKQRLSGLLMALGLAAVLPAAAGEVVAIATGGWFAVDARAVKDTTWEGGAIVGGETNVVLQSSPNAWGEVGGGTSATITWESTSGGSGTVAAATTASEVEWTPAAQSGTYTLTYLSGAVEKTAQFAVNAVKGMDVTVDGVDISVGTGAGWTYAGGVLSLTNEQDYVLSGTNTAGAVRVNVTKSANVTVSNLYLTAETPTVDLIVFGSGATNATLTLSGVNTVYAKNELAAFNVAAGAALTVSGDGELVGGKAGCHNGRGAHVYGTFNWTSGTMRDYYLVNHGGKEQGKGAGLRVEEGGTFNLSGGTLMGMQGYDGGAIYICKGTLNMTGGMITNCMATFGSAIYSYGDRKVYVRGGTIAGNGAKSLCAVSGGINVYGVVVNGNTSLLYTLNSGSVNLSGAVGTDIQGKTPVSGKSVVQVGDTYVIGVNVTQANAQLTGGTFTFCPTNAEYAAAGLALADNREPLERATEPVTYQVLPILSEVTPQTVAHASHKVYTNETVEVTNVPCQVAYGATVKVVYAAEDGYCFADGKPTASATFVADADLVQVPADQLPAEPAVARVRVTQASGDVVHSPSFAGAMNVATNGATVTLLADLAGEKLTTVYMDKSYELDGAGHSLGLRTFGGMPAFAALSNDTVRIANMTFDGQGTTGMLAVAISGRLTLTNCCVTGFVTGDGSLLATRDAEAEILDCVLSGNDAGKGSLLAFVSSTNSLAQKGDGCHVDGVTITNNVCFAAIRSSNTSGNPRRHQIGRTRIEDNGGAPALVTYEGVTLLDADSLDGNPAVVDARSALAFADAAPTALSLFVPSAIKREGEILVTNLAVAVEAENVRVLNTGYTAWGANGNVYLLSETNFPYAVPVEKAGGGWKAFRSFSEAFGSQPQPSTSVSLVHYRNVPTGKDIDVQDDDLAVGAGTNLVLRTVLRECVDGTNTTWNGTTTEMVTETGTLTVSGKLTVENVKIGGKVVLSGGTLDIGAGYSTNGAPVSVELASAPGSEEVTAITSSVYTGAELLPHFSLKGDNLVFVTKERGLSVVKVGDKVARVGSTEYDTFSAAVSEVISGGVVEIIASSNATSGAQGGECREEVKFGTGVQVAAGKSFLVKSIRATRTDAGVTVDENPAVPVTLALDGSKVTLGEGAVMAFANVAMKGTLTLEGSGILDLKDFTGTMSVRPTRTGLVATNVTDAAQLTLGTGASGTLHARGTGVWWRDGSFSARFVQTGNGVGYIDIDDYGVTNKVQVSEPVTSGRYDYHYVGPADQTGTDTNLAFGVVWCEVDATGENGARIILPTNELYAAGEWYPQYLQADGTYADFDFTNGTWKSVPSLPHGGKNSSTHLSKATLYIRNYGASNVEIATFDMVAQAKDAEDAMYEACDAGNEDLRKALERIYSINSTIAGMGETFLFWGGILTENFVGYNVVSWINAVWSCVDSLCRVCGDVYVGDGDHYTDYYGRTELQAACARCVGERLELHVVHSTKYAPCTIPVSPSRLTFEIDAAACPKTDFGGIVGCIVGSLVPAGPMTKAVASWATGIAAGCVEDFIENQLDNRVPHGMVSDTSGTALLTIPQNVTVTLTGMHTAGLPLKYLMGLNAPIFDVAGKLILAKKSGVLMPNNEFTGFQSVSSEGIVRVRNTGKVWLESKVTANGSNVKNFNVADGGLVLVSLDGKDSKIGISGQTGNGDVFSNTKVNGAWDAKADDYAEVFSNDAKPKNCTLTVDENSGDVYWSTPPTTSRVALPQTVANTSYKVYADGDEVFDQDGAYIVNLGATVTVVYTADTGYVFANHTTSAKAEFTAEGADAAMPKDQLPDKPLKLTGVTVNGDDATYPFGEGWTSVNGEVSLMRYGGYSIAGTNTEGAVRFKVAANAAVTLDNLKLTGLAANVIAFASGSTDATLTLVGTTTVSTNDYAALKVMSGAKLTLPGGGTLVGGKMLDVADGGTANIHGGVFNSTGRAPVQCESGASLAVYGGVYSVEPTVGIAAGFEAKQVGDNWIVGADIACNADNQLTRGTYTFCPTNAEYVAHGVRVADDAPITQNETTPVTWTLGMSLTYPDYLRPWSASVSNAFDTWAERCGSRDPDGVYTNAFLLNVATNREAAAVAAFGIESLVVTNDVADITVAKPIDAAPMYNGKVWLQCATNGLSEADWLDIDNGRYTEGDKSFFTLRIDFEHKVTPEAFPTEPTGSKTMRLIVK